jgi:chemotaxis protein methyltransferase WspC
MSLHGITELLRQYLGLDPASLGKSTIETAVAARMRACGVVDHDAYGSRVAADAAEFQTLAEEVSVPETWFFRGGMDLFAQLANLIRDTAHKRPFRVLSAPCSSGEEPYSLAIALAEAGVAASAWSIQGVDLSRRCLEQARLGRYRAFAFRQMDEQLRDRYFLRREREWELVPAMREAVRFQQANLLEELLPDSIGRYDLIFCRNVLIYLHAAAREQVLANLQRVLAPDGLLCTGHAEPLSFMDTKFKTIEGLALCVYAIKDAKPCMRSGPALARQAGTSGTGLNRERNATPITLPQKIPPSPSPDHGSAPDTLTGARLLADAGQIEQALRLCAAHLEDAGPSAAAFALLGVLRQARHEEDEATRCFEKALYLDPGHKDALMHLMLLCRQRGDLGRAAILQRRLAPARTGEDP